MLRNGNNCENSVTHPKMCYCFTFPVSLTDQVAGGVLMAARSGIISYKPPSQT
jgi:hypothetical protein